MPIYVKHRQVVVPGEVLASGLYQVGGNVFVEKRKYYSKVLGIVDITDNKVIKVIPLKGKYIPKEGDIIIGKIIDVGMTTWTVDINSPYTAILPASEVLPRPTDAAKINLGEILGMGDMILCKIIAFDFSRDPLITIKETRLGKISKGTLIEIIPTKVPRVIGRKGSMLKIFKDMLNVDLIVGKNGRILILSEDKEREAIALLAIKKIETEAHISGLTDRIQSFIKKMLERKER
ncbi:MAG: RNA-binding protein [Candidatus Aenigmatarchaeota archaeon]|nr:MAG: RNA-binding protein [Candidatus Aenigmarchaeota archaeon]